MAIGALIAYHDTSKALFCLVLVWGMEDVVIPIYEKMKH